MLKNFKTYNLALELYREVKGVKVAEHLRDQLLRAASSVVLNLAEGSAKPTAKDRAKFYAIAFGSLREVEDIFDILEDEKLAKQADILAAHLYKLCRS